MVNKLLGDHKISSQWYTPLEIWDRIEATFNQPQDNIFDPCPINGLNGLDKSWVQKYVYINSPSPAKPWAIKSIQTFKENPEVNIIFACFSEAVLWQVNDLMDFPVCWVRNRISWIDGNKEVKVSKNDALLLELKGGQARYDAERNSYYVANPNYLKPAKSPRNYNAFCLLSNDPDTYQRFRLNFGDLGTIRESKKVHYLG